jgi:hypothetical protein
MDTEYSATETILTQAISEFATTDYFEIPDSAEVADGCRRVLTEGVGLVKNEDDFPIGILDLNVAARLIGEQGSFSEHTHSLLRIAIAPPETDVQTLMSALPEIGSVPWFVLMKDGQYSGLVTPTAIFERFLAHFRQQPQQATVFWNNHRNSLIKAPAPANPSFCYCCPKPLGGTKPHRVEANDVITNVSGDDVCPYHLSTEVKPSIGCTAC